MDIDSSYTDYLNNIVSNTTSGASSAKLSNSVSSTDYANATDDELMDACKQFESYFVEQMLKEMEKTVPTDELDEGSNSQLIDYYKDSLTQQYAKDSTERGGLGISIEILSNCLMAVLPQWEAYYKAIEATTVREEALHVFDGISEPVLISLPLLRKSMELLR